MQILCFYSNMEFTYHIYLKSLYSQFFTKFVLCVNLWLYTVDVFWEYRKCWENIQHLLMIDLPTKSPFHTTIKTHRFFETNFTLRIVYLIIPWVTAFTSFHTTWSKQPTFYDITHIIIGGHALSDMFIQNFHAQICADKNVVNVKTNHNSNSVKELTLTFQSYE